ncbi:nuclear envelope [Backusella circina FSU 941]|nr:nuclear envelope [Backusella circina FSU 941]
MDDCQVQKQLPIKPTKHADLKRHKTGIQKRSTRGAMLDTMDKGALINIINSVLQAHSEVREDIMSYIPEPTISSSVSVLHDMEKKFADSFPYNRNGPGRDDYTFSRVREYLTDLIDTITQYANHFTSSLVFPTTCFAFLDHATHMAHRLPVWDSNVNNTLKKDLYQDLNDFWKIAIQTTASKLREGECYSPESVSAWAKNLAQHNSFTGGLFTDAVHEFTKQLGSMIGFPEESADTLRDAAICHLAGLETSIPSTSVVGARR